MWKVPQNERPREKAKIKGIQNCSDSELLAIILGSGGQQINVSELAQRIIMDYPLNELKDITLNELKHYNGVGEAKSLMILAAMELGKRVYNNLTIPTILNNTDDIYRYYSPKLMGLDHEEVWICSLNIKNEIIGEHMIASGGIHNVQLDPTLMYKRALKDGAYALVIVHNHPSGNPTPSGADDHVTQLAREGSQYLHMNLIDHVIIGHNSYYSYKEKKRKTYENEQKREEKLFADLLPWKP